MVNISQVADSFNPSSHRVVDVRDPTQEEGQVFVIGGLVSELFITLTCLHEYIMANPAHASFSFSKENLQPFLKDLLVGHGFPDGAITLNILPTTDQSGGETVEEPIDIDTLDDNAYMMHCLTPSFIDDFGLRFFFENCNDLQILKDIIRAMYELFIEIGRHGEKDLIEIPPEPTAEPPAEGEEAKEPTEDEKEAYAHQVELINQQNAEIEKHNAEIHELKDKIRIEKRETNFDEMNDCCVMIMQNYRDPPPDEEEHEPSQE